LGFLHGHQPSLLRSYGWRASRGGVVGAAKVARRSSSEGGQGQCHAKFIIEFVAEKNAGLKDALSVTPAFWNSSDEFLFPNGSFFPLHGSYAIKGYFIVRSGGIHQGVASSSFEKIDDAQVMLRPGLTVNKMTSDRCKS
jgi:hypothetical protein